MTTTELTTATTLTETELILATISDMDSARLRLQEALSSEGDSFDFIYDGVDHYLYREESGAISVGCGGGVWVEDIVLDGAVTSVYHAAALATAMGVHWEDYTPTPIRIVASPMHPASLEEALREAGIDVVGLAEIDAEGHEDGGVAIRSSLELSEIEDLIECDLVEFEVAS